MGDNLDFRSGDSDNNLLRKILGRLGMGIPLSGTITASESIPDGADVAQGAKADAAASDNTSAWSVVALLKGILGKLSAALTVSGTVTAAQATAANLNATVVQATAANLKVDLSGSGALPTVTTVSTVSALTSGNVGGFTSLVTIAPAVTASSAYVAGYAVGGKQTLANAVRANGTAILDSIMVLDRANQKAALDILIFESDPSSATITDHAAFVFSTDDLKVLARIPVAAGDYVTYNGKATATLKGLGVVLKAASGTSLYAAIVTSGTPTFAATTDVQVRYGLLQD